MSRNDRHGTARITLGGRQHTVDLTRIHATVTQLIAWGLILQCEKTKAGRQDDLNGKNAVTVGPYQQATDQSKADRRYRVYVGAADLYTSSSAYDAAMEFVNWVGRDVAREAVREYARNH